MIDFKNLIKRYAQLFPRERLSKVSRFLASAGAAEVTVGRNNFRGHLTASALLVDAPARRILLLKHPKFDRLLQPGGHFESANEGPVDAATRRLFHETRYKNERVRYLPYDFDFSVPIDIDSHHIPEIAGPPKEPGHLHHDLRYVFLSLDGAGTREAPTPGPFSEQPPGTYWWHDVEVLGKMASFTRLFEKLQYFLSKDSARRRFYIGLANQFPIANPITTVVVTHVLPDSVDFLEMLSRKTELIGVIPKPKSLNRKANKKLKELGIRVLRLNRAQLPGKLPSILKHKTPHPTVLLDIGGWFSTVMHSIPAPLAGQVLGIVEDTRNGQNKYEAIARARAFPFPVVSVAESALKGNEDFLVGQSVVFSTDAILRECGLVLEYLDCGVIGYGKIGKSIAHHLRTRGIKCVVVERNPLRQVEALNALCTLRSRDFVNRNVDVVFCATGSRATGIIDFRNLRSGAFVLSVTSSDDEFDFKKLKKEYKPTPTASPHVTRYDSPHNHFYLVNRGNAVNFLHDAVLWEFIQLVRGGIFVAARNLADGLANERMTGQKGPGFKSLFQLSDQDQAAVARLWLETLLLGIKLDVV